MTPPTQSAGSLFLQSALAVDSPVMPNAEILPWFEGRRRAHRFHLEPIPFSQLVKWGFDPQTGNLCHASRRFFSIEGLRVRTNWGATCSPASSTAGG